MRRGVVALCVALALPARDAFTQLPVGEAALAEYPMPNAAALSASLSRPATADSLTRGRATLLTGGAVGVAATARQFVVGREPEGTSLPGIAASRSIPARARVGMESWWPPLASAILPGAGQGILRQDRALAFLAVESYGWLRYVSDVREGRRQRNAYRGLASRVARANLSDDRPVGDFEYYERMEHYIESGVFDTSPDEGVQPELNPESFNGFIWLRARTTFWEDPANPPPSTSEAYFAALDYYAQRAIQPQFRWSWRNAQLEQDLFRRTIVRSNDAFRRSIQDLGVIIANHALSTVDAYVTVRIRSARGADSGVGIEASIPWSPGQTRPRAEDQRR